MGSTGFSITSCLLSRTGGCFENMLYITIEDKACKIFLSRNQILVLNKNLGCNQNSSFWV